MRIRNLAAEPFWQMPYEAVSRGEGIGQYALPFVAAEADLPPGIDAIVATSDLQGREARALAVGEPRLLGERLSDELVALANLGQLPPLERLGVILAGDFWARPGLDRRGGSGDVRAVWRAFAARCRWVAGVAGNHDAFSGAGSLPDLQAFRREIQGRLMDGSLCEFDGLRIAGISGITGNPAKPFRRTKEQFVAEIGRLFAMRPDMLVLHEGPDVPGTPLVGSAPIRCALAGAPEMLVVRGHSYWDTPLASLGRIQVLNVDSRVVVLRSSRC